MSYEKQTWNNKTWGKGQKKLEEQLNHMEDGIVDASQSGGTIVEGNPTSIPEDVPELEAIKIGENYFKAPSGGDKKYRHNVFMELQLSSDKYYQLLFSVDAYDSEQLTKTNIRTKILSFFEKEMYQVESLGLKDFTIPLVGQGYQSHASAVVEDKILTDEWYNDGNVDYVMTRIGARIDWYDYGEKYELGLTAFAMQPSAGSTNEIITVETSNTFYLDMFQEDDLIVIDIVTEL